MQPNATVMQPPTTHARQHLAQLLQSTGRYMLPELALGGGHAARVGLG